MSHLEPTYLRYIYDSLIEGSIHPENAAELPDGLIGLYEDAFNERNAVFERQKLLNRFAIWALLKKEVSAAFVAEVLEEPEEEIQDFISTYSAWFNSPESGKYQLYHERLKVYLLQKMSEGELSALHEKLISRLERAIEEQKADEFECYGLEFLAVHLGVESMIKGDGKQLLDLAYSQTHWLRQLKMSKGFNWSKNGLKAVMDWASKYNDDEVIECGLQMVDLYHQEQNAAPQIVALVADGDFESALKRIDQFGGNDKKGLQRKFILYMLCLMELTLLNSKNKPFRKEGIEKLLRHMDDKIPSDLSILNWDNFFPSYLVFLMSCECHSLGIDYLVLYSHSYCEETKWIKDNGPYNDVEFEVMIVSNSRKREFFLQEKKCETLSIISTQLSKQGKFDMASLVMQDAINLARKIDDKKIESIAKISTELTKQGKIKEAEALVREVINYAQLLDEHYKNYALSTITSELAKQGKIDEAFRLNNQISDDFRKNFSKKDISDKLAIQGNFKDALECARNINVSWRKSDALNSISAELWNQGDPKQAQTVLNESLECAREIIFDCKSETLKDISIELNRRGQFEKAELIMQEAISSTLEIKKSINQSNALKSICTELTNQGRFSESIEYSQKISFESDKFIVLIYNAIEYMKQKQVDNASIWMKVVVEYELGIKRNLKEIIEKFISHDMYKEVLDVMEFYLKDVRGVNEQRKTNKLLSSIGRSLINQGKCYEAMNCIIALDFDYFINYEKRIFSELAKQGKINLAIEYIKEISEYSDYNISAIVTYLLEYGHISEATEITADINNYKIRINPLIEISAELYKHGRLDEASFLMKEALECANYIKDEGNKNSALRAIATQFTEQDRIDDAILISEVISEDYYRSTVFSDISYALAKNRKNDKAIEFALKIGRDSDKFEALKNISIELAKHGEIQESIDLIYAIDDFWKCQALVAISKVLRMQGKLIESEVLLKRSMDCTIGINDKMEKEEINSALTVALAEQGNIKKAVDYSQLLSSKSSKEIAYNSIIDQLVKLGELDLIVDCMGRFNSEEDKSEVLNYIAVKLVKKQKIENAFECIKLINVEWIKSKANNEVSIELAKQGVFKKAINCAHFIDNNYYYRIDALGKIALELAKRNNWLLAECAIIEIPKKIDQQSCWKQIAENIMQVSDINKSILVHKNLMNKEASKFLLNGWVDNLQVNSSDLEISIEAIKFLENNVESIEYVLLLHSLRKLYFEECSSKELERFNNTLNIQWAIDIKNQLPN